MLPFNSRSSHIAVAFLAAALTLDLGVVRALAQGAPDSNAKLFRYNPRTLSDEQFRMLVDAIAADSDFETWPKIRVEDKDGLLSIVDRVYDFFLSSRTGDRTGAKPRTALRLAEIIKDKNRLTSDVLEVGRELSIPPIVARPYTEVRDWAGGYLSVYPSAKGSDVYWDTTLHCSGADPSKPKCKTPGKENVYYNANMNHDKWNSQAFGGLGMRWAITVTVQLSDTQAKALAAKGIGTVIPRNRVAMELLQGPDCLVPFAESRYQGLARQKLSSNLPSLVTRAKLTPLILIDYDFVGGHGSRVRGVVDSMLDQFGVGALKPFVFNFDLNPKSNSKVGLYDHPLKIAMDKYGDYLLGINVINFLDDWENGSHWMLNPDASTGGLTIPIAPFVLQAAIQSSIATGAWLNMSWRGDRTDWVLPVDFERLISGSNIFGVVAAGNEATDIMSDRSPQDASTKYSKFVNVTNGTSTGIPCGSRTGSQGGRVHLLAQGLGTDAATKARVSGSSYASPLVATAAWLKHLLAGTPASRMREHLIGASTYVPSQAVRTVDAKGVFDPAKLIVGIGPHYRNAADSADVVFKTMRLDAGSCGMFSYTEGTEVANDLVVFERNGAFHLAMRSATQEFPHLKERDLCSPSDLKFSATLESGETRTIDGVENFAKSVSYLRF